MVGVNLHRSGKKDAGRGQPGYGCGNPLSQPLALLQPAVGFGPALQACQSQQLRSRFRFLPADLHEIVPLTAQRAIGQDNDVSLDPLLAGFQQTASHAEGFIVGVRRKHQPGAGRQLGRRKGQEYVFRVQRHETRVWFSGVWYFGAGFQEPSFQGPGFQEPVFRTVSITEYKGSVARVLAFPARFVVKCVSKIPPDRPALAGM